MPLFVFLDDERDPEQVFWNDAYRRQNIQWIIIRNFQDFKEFVDTTVPQQLKDYEWGFDHDIQDFCPLTGKEQTGKECLEHLLWKCLLCLVPIPICHFHTQNPAGKENMVALYRSFRMEQHRRGLES